MLTCGNLLGSLPCSPHVHTHTHTHKRQKAVTRVESNTILQDPKTHYVTSFEFNTAVTRKKDEKFTNVSEAPPPAPSPPFTNQSSYFLSIESPTLIPRFFKNFSPKLCDKTRNRKPAFKVKQALVDWSLLLCRGLGRGFPCANCFCNW